jgi:hypothetical protein
MERRTEDDGVKKLPQGDTTNLPPPNLTTDQIDRLLETLQNNNGEATAASNPSLRGQQVLIPFGPCAFWEGELNPSPYVDKPTENTRADDDTTNASTEKSSLITPLTGKEEEEVFVAVKGSASPETAAENLISMPVSRAMEWLQKHGSSHSKQQQSKPATKKSPNPSAPSKTQPSVKATNAPSSKSSTATRKNREEKSAAVAFPMVEIQEEYTEDGQQVYGKAIDVTARLEALWKKDQQASQQRTQEEEEKVAPYDDDYDRHVDSATAVDNKVPPQAYQEQEHDNVVLQEPEPTSKITDEEYDRLSRRLEELALLEEQEQQAKQKSKGLLAFKKGFLLNAKKPKGKPTPASKSIKANSGNSAASLDSLGATRKSKVNIDLNQNIVHEIPSEGRQQPLPLRQVAPIQQQQRQQSNRTMDPTMFSGQIHERPVAVPSVGATGTPGMATTSTTVKSETPKKKRVSRFAQERQQQQG